MQSLYLAAVLFENVGRVHDDATSAAEEAPDMMLKTMPTIYQRAVAFQTRNERFSISSSIRRHTTTHTQQARALSSRLAAATAATTTAAAAQPKQGRGCRSSHGTSVTEGPLKHRNNFFQTVFVYRFIPTATRNMDGLLTGLVFHQQRCSLHTSPGSPSSSPPSDVRGRLATALPPMPSAPSMF